MRKGKILIVEDNRIVAEDIKQKLIDMGYTVTDVATSGEKALEAAGRNVPDIALMDIQLGEGMNGIDTAAQLRKQYQVPVIYLTAYADHNTISRAKITEPFGYIIKPFDDKELHSAVEIGLYKHQMEHKLRVSEEKYRSILESMPDAIFICSEDFTIEYMNPRMISQIGYNATGEKCHKAVHGLDEICLWCERSKVNAQMSWESSVISPKDGRNYLVTHAPIPKSDGTVSKLSVYRDITEYKKIQARLRQAQKMEAVGNLAGGVAHDFNNILSSIIGFTELLLDDATPGTGQEDNLQEIYAAGKRAKDLVKQILAFARYSDDEMKPIQVDLIVKEALKLIRSTTPSTVEFKLNTESRSLILADSTKIHQIVMNLCTNAADAMDNEGVLSVELKDEQLDQELIKSFPDLKPGDYLKLSVSDTGSGISPEISESIFEPYFTTKAMGAGTGMGLATVYGIVKQYGGEIVFDTEPGKGSKFSVYLPIIKKRTRETTVKARPIPTGNERILFVDDEIAITKMNSQAFSGLGYQVTTRTSSIGALELFREKPDEFDMIITDMTMPGMTGDKLAVEIMKIRPEIPVILCTGYSKKISDKTASKIGIRAFIHKPVNKADLARTIRRVLDGKDEP